MNGDTLLKTVFLTPLISCFLIAGQAFGIQIKGTEEYNLYGNEAYIETYDSSVLNIHPGSSVSHLSSYNNAFTKVEGGTISFFKAYNNSRAEIHNPEKLSWLIVNEECKIKIFATQLVFAGGHLSGRWENGKLFSFWVLKGQVSGQPPLPPSDTLPENITFVNPPNMPLPETHLTPLYQLLLSK